MVATTISTLIPLLFLHFSLALTLNQEGLFLKKIKLGFSDPDNALSNWNERNDTPCNWSGVLCDPISSSVISIDLSSTNIAGPFPTLLCRLPNLTHISFSNNYINSTLPNEISSCKTLTFLDLSENLLVGKIPPSLPEIPTLMHLDLSGNNFSGEIPPTFASFRRLQVLSLVSNLLNETIPAFLGNLTNLRQLNLSYNPFTARQIPPEFGNLTSLETLWLAGCNLVGQIPESLGNLRNLRNLDLSGNFLRGSIPETITMLSSAIQIELYHNELSGEIPAAMGSLKSLVRFDASMNMIEGSIPGELCGLNLESLNLYSNRLVGDLPESIARSTRLYELKLFDNRLTGSLPADFGRNSPLVSIDLSNNLFTGDIPAEICKGGVLEELLLINNSFSGSVPESLGHCLSLIRVRLRDNQFYGKIPASFWGLPHVYMLDLAGNSFSGDVSDEISKAQNLSQLVISKNQFSGKIPPEIGNLQNLFEFSGDDNRLNGSLPTSLGGLAMLGKLNLNKNQLSGSLLTDIWSWTRLSELNLAENEFSGHIPEKLGDLPALNYLDLSRNLLTGPVPTELQNLKLNQFNLSFNLLSGELPPLFSKSIYNTSFLGNPNLCGDLIGSCSKSHREGIKNRGCVWLLRSIFILTGLVFVTGIVWFYWTYRSFTKSEKKRALDKSKWTLTSFHKLGFSEYEIWDCLDEDSLIGSGGAGKVYKAVLSNGDAVAVKKLWGSLKPDDSQGDNGFEAEVRTLGKIRHKNIVKLWCCCTNRDCKLLVYEYMPNGSLGDLLHSSKSGLLDWPTRYKIAVDAAEGLSYLHHDCVPPIVHRDVKSNNILLDAEFGARVADFGVAKILEAFGKGSNSMSAVAGSYGYIAPEYAYTLRVNEKSDIYSFGVVILELVTGKLPVDPEFGEAKDLVKWVCTTLEKKGVDHVLDPRLLSCYREEMCRVFNVGLMCTNPLPINRPTMRKVVKMLLETNTENKPKPEKKDGKLSPYYYEDSSDQGSVI